MFFAKIVISDADVCLLCYAYVMQNCTQHKGRQCFFINHSQSDANQPLFGCMRKWMMKDDGMGWFGIERDEMECVKLKDIVTSTTCMYIIVYSPPLFFLASSGAVIQVSSESKCTSPFVG